MSKTAVAQRFVVARCTRCKEPLAFVVRETGISLRWCECAAGRIR